MAYVNYWVRNEATAEDICQEACLKILGYMHDHPDCDEEHVTRLMYKVARNGIYDYFKKASTKYEVPTDILDMEALFMEEMASGDDDWMVSLLYRNIRQLNAVEKTVIYGRLGGKSNEVLAKELGRTEHAVACIYTRTVRKLKTLVIKAKKELLHRE